MKKKREKECVDRTEIEIRERKIKDKRKVINEKQGRVKTNKKRYDKLREKKMIQQINNNNKTDTKTL